MEHTFNGSLSKLSNKISKFDPKNDFCGSSDTFGDPVLKKKFLGDNTVSDLTRNQNLQMLEDDDRITYFKKYKRNQDFGGNFDVTKSVAAQMDDSK